MHEGKNERRSLKRVGHIQHEAVLHVSFQHAFVGLGDGVRCCFDGLDVRGDAVFAAEVQHLLRFLHATDDATGDDRSVQDQRKWADLDRFRWCTNPERRRYYGQIQERRMTTYM